MAGAHYELIRPLLSCFGLPLLKSGEKTLVSSLKNAIKMFPVRVVNGGAPATLRFLQRHHLAVAGFVSTVAFDLDAREYLEMQVMIDLSRQFRCDIDVHQLFRCMMVCGWMLLSVQLILQQLEQEAIKKVLPK